MAKIKLEYPLLRARPADVIMHLRLYSTLMKLMKDCWVIYDCFEMGHQKKFRRILLQMNSKITTAEAKNVTINV
jgi:hypothetical protein